MKRRIASRLADTSGIPSRLPIRTEDLTAGQTAQISGGAIRWRRILSDLLGIDLGTSMPETSAAGPLM